MEVREAQPADVERIERVARASLTGSYSHALNEDRIEEAVERWYGERLQDELEDETSLFLVAEDEGTVSGFSQSHLIEDAHAVGEIAWLHVDPDHRGRGLGEKLLERTERELLARGASQYRGRVLAANESGAEFYAAHGYEEAERREVQVGDRTYEERTFVSRPESAADRDLPLEPRTGPEGRTVYVAHDESERGSEGPLYVTYVDDDRHRRYGYVCGNCGGFDVVMDSMGSMECTRCGNRRKPTRWDASYL